MSTAKKVMQVFALLSNSLPNSTYSQVELLEDANSLVGLFEEQLDEPHFDLRTGGRPMSEWASDIVMNQKPWLLVSKERVVMELYEMEDDCYAASYERVKYLLEHGV